MKITSAGFTFDTTGYSTWDVFDALQSQLNEYMTTSESPETLEYLEFHVEKNEIHVGLKQ